MIRIKVSGLIRDNEDESKNGIFTLLDNLKQDYKNGILPKKKFRSSSKKDKILHMNNISLNPDNSYFFFSL